MSVTIENIVEKIGVLNPLHVKKLRKNLKRADPEFHERANKFLETYQALLDQSGRTMDYGIDCYLRMITDMNFETLRFRETNEYSSKSFDEVNERVYANPGIMEYYMHGLLLSQFLWKYHYDTLVFFHSIIQKNRGSIKSYLEIGGGHGLYVSEAMKVLGDKVQCTVVDISDSSLAIAKQMINNSSVHYVHSDIFKYQPESRFDFITMGEVLEHVEDPIALLKVTAGLLNEGGRIFITTPTNAPTIDHIYLFRTVDDVRKLIAQSGLSVEEELSISSEDLSVEQSEELGISILYCACLKKQN